MSFDDDHGVGKCYDARARAGELLVLRVGLLVPFLDPHDYSRNFSPADLKKIIALTRDNVANDLGNDRQRIRKPVKYVPHQSINNVFETISSSQPPTVLIILMRLLTIPPQQGQANVPTA